MLFDSEKIAREIAICPIPIITGIGHEDDLTVADLVSDHRAATPTAAIVDLLPSRDIEKNNFLLKKKIMKDYFLLYFDNKKSSLSSKISLFKLYSPHILIKTKRTKIKHIFQLLNALSPTTLLRRGFAFLTDIHGNSIYSVASIKKKDKFIVKLFDGQIHGEVDDITFDKN